MGVKGIKDKKGERGNLERIKLVPDIQKEKLGRAKPQLPILKIPKKPYPHRQQGSKFHGYKNFNEFQPYLHCGIRCFCFFLQPLAK